MTNLIISIFFLLSLATLPALATPESKEIDIMVEDAAEPWSKADGTGYANDIVIAAFKEMGITTHLKVVPYARCKSTTLSGSAIGCFNMTWIPEFEGLIKLASPPLVIQNADVFQNLAKPLPRPPQSQCKLPSGSIVGIVNEYEYPAETMALFSSGAQFTKARTDSQNLQRLALGRLQAAIIITNDLEPRDQKARLANLEDKVGFAFNCGHQTGSIGFSLKHPEGLWAYRTYEEGYRKMVARGQLKKITAKWFPSRIKQKSD